jgi:hypothetical protein
MTRMSKIDRVRSSSAMKPGGSLIALLLASCSESSSSAAPAPPGRSAEKLAPGDTSHGANNFYGSDKVTVQKVKFVNQYKMNVTGNLFVPKDSKRAAKRPAIVVGHPMGAVKEQSANLYATKMAEQGSTSSRGSSRPTCRPTAARGRFPPASRNC